MAHISQGCSWRGAELTCKGVPPGRYPLSLTPHAMAYVDSLLQKRNETAGGLGIDFQNGELNIVQTAVTRGKRDTVGIPRGVILPWHSHPGKCPPRGNDCALDVPSDADMALVLEDCMHGSWAHTIFAHTGTFTVSLTPQLRQHLDALSGQARKQAEKQIEKRFADIHRSFEKKLQAGDIDLERFRPQWMDLARETGFDATFFPKGVVPHLTMIVS
ncbi:hypothetical protein WJX74_008235 [Apatococcus lobatus]|uniref:Uncharacterized protein n=1 Tax=Apatococcus lobatus TaxID=904363 RepID=A0AAW1R0U4_9CHLO